MGVGAGRGQVTHGLPMLCTNKQQMQTWVDEHGWDLPHGINHAIVIWVHDESIFYAHDCQQTAWYHKDETAKPYAKGKGASLMVADFISADYGWLHSPDGKESAQVVFHPGKNCEGYFTNKDILAQVEQAMSIVGKHYPNEDHKFIYDNAMTHCSWPADSLSAIKMPKNSLKPESNFGVLINVIGADGQLVHGPDGKLLKQKVQMRNRRFNGQEQEFYYPEGHQKAGIFKGMAEILTEHGYNVSKKRAQCGKSFADCSDQVNNCCCHCILFNKPDFAEEELLLETVELAPTVHSGR